MLAHQKRSDIMNWFEIIKFGDKENMAWNYNNIASYYQNVSKIEDHLDIAIKYHKPF